MTFDLTKTLVALPLVALLAGGAWAQTEGSSGTGTGDATGAADTETGTAGDASGAGDTTESVGEGTAGTPDTDKGGEDATAGNQAPWAPAIGNALFEEGFTGMRSMEDAKSRWTALSAQDQNTVRADCERFQTEGATGRTAVVQTGMEPISSTDMTSLCSMIGSF